MRALIAGSHGFIGSALTDRLITDGAEVHRVLRRRTTTEDAFFDPKNLTLDLSGLPGGVLDGFDVVYAVGGDPLAPRRWGPAKRHSIWTSRVDVVSELARAVARTVGAPPVLITMSAVGIYGDRGDEVLTEDSSAGKGFVASLCQAWEHATAPALTNGGRVVTARSGIVFGPDGGFIERLKPLFRRGLGGRLGNGEQWMSWIDRDDAVEALVRFAADDTYHGDVNLTSPNPIRNREFTASFADALGRRAPFIVPRAAIVAATGRRVASEFILQSVRVLPERLTSTGFTFGHPDANDAIRRALDRKARA